MFLQLIAVPAQTCCCCSHLQRFASEGARVLALAYKQLPGELTPSELRHLPRDEAESGLRFAGFAVFRSPLKEDSEPALRMLRESRHQLIMITGGRFCPVALWVCCASVPCLRLSGWVPPLGS
jgi:cation-transporting ATPase 13A1